jgi:hypothetical protein
MRAVHHIFPVACGPALLATALALASSACTSAAPAISARCEAIEVDPTRELLVTDAAVVSDASLGFPRVMGAALGAQSDAEALAWVEAWASVPGEATLADEMGAAWGASRTGGLALQGAPFELIAIVNRVDLATLGDRRAGELRFV